MPKIFLGFFKIILPAITSPITTTLSLTRPAARNPISGVISDNVLIPFSISNKQSVLKNTCLIQVVLTLKVNLL